MTDQHSDTIECAAVAAGAIGVPGVYSFGLDVSVVSGIWVGMLMKIAEDSGHPIDGAYAMKVATAVASSVAGYVAGSKVFIQIARWFPGMGTAAAMSVNVTLNYVYTKRLGKAFAGFFDHSDFELLDAAELVLILIPLIGKE
ncbi:hypothetical protein ACGFWE_27825 [Streptomyces sp. NPDC048523]|uniref:hypothetical protein n=1 Tax=unclassified Streptomyces TaxID=2593676 RepID=UPI0033269DCF